MPPASDPFPPMVARLLPGATLTEISVGRSRALVFVAVSGPIRRAVKWMPPAEEMGLEGEARRLDWLQGRVAAPRLVAYAHSDHGEALVCEWIDAPTALELLPRDPVTVGRRLGEALLDLHRIAQDECPFDASPESELHRARLCMERGLVRVDDLEAEFDGRSAIEVLEDLERRVPPGTGSCLTHGDPCLPNLLLTGGARGGTWLDVGRLGVGDPARDVALALASLRRNEAPEEALRAFTQTYGPLPSRDRLEWYALLDQFF